jgi:2-polyprenyl-3-methyl-5-hydroxy-6-metoxy-1,4-benzoquinol methylase
MSATHGQDYFDALYAAEADPWQFATSPYERAKYAATIAALPAAPIAAAFEVGCSIGVLTRQLAAQCGTLLAVDLAEAPLVAARQRCADCANVTIAAMRIPQEWPGETFDLVVLSEVLYFLAPEDVAATARRTRHSLSGGGHALLVHYTLPTNYPMRGDAAVALFMAESGGTPIRQQREAQYRLDLLRF